MSVGGGTSLGAGFDFGPFLVDGQWDGIHGVGVG